MKKKNIYTMFMALMVLCIGGLLTACDKKDDEESKGTDPTPSGKTIVSKEYKDYLASTQMQSDVQTTIEGGIADGFADKYGLMVVPTGTVASRDTVEQAPHQQQPEREEPGADKKYTHLR